MSTRAEYSKSGAYLDMYGMAHRARASQPAFHLSVIKCKLEALRFFRITCRTINLVSKRSTFNLLDIYLDYLPMSERGVAGLNSIWAVHP